MGITMTISWPPADSNQTALNFVGNLTSPSGDLNKFVDAVAGLGKYGPAQVPAKSVIIYQTYAFAPAAQYPPPLSNQLVSPEAPKDTESPSQVSLNHVESIVT